MLHHGRLSEATQQRKLGEELHDAVLAKCFCILPHGLERIYRGRYGRRVADDAGSMDNAVFMPSAMVFDEPGNV